MKKKVKILHLSKETLTLLSVGSGLYQEPIVESGVSACETTSMASTVERNG